MKPGKIGTPTTIQEHQKRERADSKVHIQNDEIKMDASKREFINAKLAEIAKLIAPEMQGITYKGAFAAYLFEQSGNALTKNKLFFVIEQTDLQNVEEGFCDQAYRALKEKLMSFYGKKQPRKVKRG